MPTRRYDAGSTSTRTQHWYTPSTDATAALQSLQTIRNRSRDLSRNNPWVRKANSVLVNSIVGEGILAQFRGSKRNVQLATAAWRKWAETTQCDALGMLNFYGLQALAAQTIIESGSVIVRLRPRQMSDGLAVPMQIQIMEPDHLVTNLDGETKSGNVISRGIEYNAIGQRVAYYLYRHHPHGPFNRQRGDFGRYSRVPAEEVRHVYRMDRAGMEDGVPWVAPNVITLRELDIYEDAYLKRQQIANLHAGFIHTEDDIDDETEAYTDMSGGLVPGSLSLMRPNRSIEFNSPPPAGDFGPFTMDALRRVAAGYGITFEALTGNLSEVNFSSARMGWQDQHRNVQSWRWNMLIPGFCQGVADWFMDFGQFGAVEVDWTAPARTMVDPAKEIPPMIAAIRAGLSTPSEAIRKQGYDPERLLSEWANDAAMIDKLGLVLDCDPRQDIVRTTDEAEDADN